MAFTLADLSDMQRRTLAALKEYNIASRTHLADKTRLTAPQTSVALNRLECLGFAKQAQSPSRAWCITKVGAALFDVPEPEPDKTPDITVAQTVPEPATGQALAEDKMPDILPDIPNQLQYEPDGGVPNPHTMSFRAGCGIDYSFTPREAIADDPDSVAPALVTESSNLPLSGFPRLHDAMFVLDVLVMRYCRQSPAFTAEINRIATFLQGAA